MGYKEDTIKYYNENAADFVSETLAADMSEIYKHFEKHLKPESRILDLGCGSGRDTKHFLKKGYSVVPVDGSSEICRLAGKVTGIEVACTEFSEIDFSNEFDAVWACASLLHLDEDEIAEVIDKISSALKANGILYVSFKYGNGTRIRNERFFYDCDEAKIRELFNKDSGFEILETFITEDVRPERHEDKWVNAIIAAI